MLRTQTARGIGTAAIQYSQSNNGIMAPDLASMLEGQYFTAEYLLSPRSKKRVPPDLRQWTKEKRALWVEANTSYVYLGRGMRADLDSTKIVAYQKYEESDGRYIAVCFGDNHTESLPIEDARRRIMAQTGVDPVPASTLPESDRQRLKDLGYIVPPELQPPPAEP